MNGSLVALIRLNLSKQIASRLPLIALLGCLLLAGLPYYIQLLSLRQNGFSRVSLDFGLSLITWASVLAGTVIGSTSIPEEVESKSILSIIAHPISRLTFFLGQLIGNGLTLSISVTLWVASLGLSLKLLGASFSVPHLICCLSAILMSSLMCLTIASTASIRCSPPLAGVIAVALYTIGGLSSDFVQSILAEDRDNHYLSDAVLFLKKVLPQFDYFDVQPVVVHHYINLPLPQFCLGLAVYTFAWIAFLILVAEILLAKKDY